MPPTVLTVLRAEIQNQNGGRHRPPLRSSGGSGVKRGIVIGFAGNFGDDLDVRNRAIFADHDDGSRQKAELGD